MDGAELHIRGLHAVTRDASVEMSNSITRYLGFKGQNLVGYVSALTRLLDWRRGSTKWMLVNVTNSEQRTSWYRARLTTWSACLQSHIGQQNIVVVNSMLLLNVLVDMSLRCRSESRLTRDQGQNEAIIYKIRTNSRHIPGYTLIQTS
jgi:hypothetical protein